MKLPQRLLALGLFLFCSYISSAQNQRISGSITDEASGLPVEGVTVSLKGSNKTTVSDQNGEFILLARSIQRRTYFKFCRIFVQRSCRNE